jgi:ATP-dependent RNA helicase RhlE
MHRIGRTGRADRKGIAIIFVTANDAERIEKIETLMNFKIPVNFLPEDLVVSALLTEDEKPKMYQPNMNIKAPRKKPTGAAFHEKLEKNQKVSVKFTRADKMREKYGKPKTRGQKPKGKK